MYGLVKKNNIEKKEVLWYNAVKAYKRGIEVNYLIVVDMQNDFITGALAAENAITAAERAKEKIRGFDGKVIFTRDTHSADYLDTQEGKKLPVTHCVKPEYGWQICSQVAPFAENALIFDKNTFGSIELAEYLKSQDDIESITLIGVCTDICVISNALLIKAFLPEVSVFVDESCCAGVTEESHNRAIDAMKMCQIEIIGAD